MNRRFVVQRHTVSADDEHYDLMLEDGEVLVTFQLSAPPAPGVTGRRAFDHRPRYLTYEGEISGGRGRVAIWDAGQAHDLSGDPRAPRYAVRLAGRRLRAELVLTGGVAEGDDVRLESAPERRHA